MAGGIRGGEGEGGTIFSGDERAMTYQQRLMRVASERGYDNLFDYIYFREERRPRFCRGVSRLVMRCEQYGNESEMCTYFRFMLAKCEAVKKEHEEKFQKAAAAANFVTMNAFMEHFI